MIELLMKIFYLPTDILRITLIPFFRLGDDPPIMDRSSIDAWIVRYRYWIDNGSIYRQMLSQHLQFLTASSSPPFTLPSTLLVRQFLSPELHQNIFPTRSRLVPRPFNYSRIFNFSFSQKRQKIIPCLDIYSSTLKARKSRLPLLFLL